MPLTNEHTNRNVLGRAVRLMRQRAGITQKELADLAGTGHTYVSRVESGLIDPGWSTLQRLLLAVGADPHQFADALANAEEREPDAKS